MKLGLMLGVTVKYLFSMDTQEFLWDSTVAPGSAEQRSCSGDQGLHDQSEHLSYIDAAIDKHIKTLLCTGYVPKMWFIWYRTSSLGT